MQKKNVLPWAEGRHGCKADVDTMHKDAKTNNWLDKYETAKPNPAHFRKLSDFQAECPSAGPGKKRNSYSKARAVEVIASENIRAKYVRMDYFDFECGAPQILGL